MADDIALKVSALKITVEENQTTALPDISEIKNHHDFSLALVGKVMTRRAFNFMVLKRTLN